MQGAIGSKYWNNIQGKIILLREDYKWGERKRSFKLKFIATCNVFICCFWWRPSSLLTAEAAVKKHLKVSIKFLSSIKTTTNFFHFFLFSYFLLPFLTNRNIMRFKTTTNIIYNNSSSRNSCYFFGRVKWRNV